MTDTINKEMLELPQPTSEAPSNLKRNSNYKEKYNKEISSTKGQLQVK